MIRSAERRVLGHLPAADPGDSAISALHEVQRPATRVGRYEAPGTLERALHLLAEAEPGSARPIAGGTDLLVELDRGHHGETEVLIDLGRIEGLNQIEVSPTDVRLGALVTHSQVVASDVCRQRLLPLAQACLEVGSPQLRNRATVAGNVVTASPANDTISALLALGASVEIASARETRSMPVIDFITGFRTTALAPDELVTAVVVPLMDASTRGMFVKLGLRRAQAISVVHLAATVSLTDGLVTDATLGLGSVAATVVLAPGLDDALRGRPLDGEALDRSAEIASEIAAPIDDLRSTADYRSEMVATMTRRAFAALAANEQAARWPDIAPRLWGASFDGRFPTGPDFEISVDHSTEIVATLNSVRHSAGAATGRTLLDWLRGSGFNGVKEGCAEGECGACTVDLDGAAVMSCLVPAARAAGATITTVEGLAPHPNDEDLDGDAPALHAIQQAFVDTGAVQCGFCTPGLLMSCAKLLEEIPRPSPEQVMQGLAGNLCRCTGYRAIESAVEIASGSSR